MSEVSLNNVDFSEYDGCCGLVSSAKISSISDFYHKIFSQQDDCIFSKTVALRSMRSEIDRKVQKMARETGRELPAMGLSGSVEAKIEASWGGNDSKVSVGVSGEVHDGEGNYAKAEVKQDSDGKGSVSASGGCSKQSSKGND